MKIQEEKNTGSFPYAEHINGRSFIPAIITNPVFTDGMSELVSVTLYEARS